MIIGITGGIGSGKSTIAQELAERGFAVYDCDREAKRIIAENPTVQKAIIELLGENAFTPPFRDGQGVGSYNTAYVSKCVFADPKLLEALNKIVHPAIKEDILSLPLREGKGVGSVLFIESAILFEADLDALCDKIIVVDAPEEVRIARTIARDYRGLDTPENINKVRARIRAQKTPAGLSAPQGKIYTILNDGRMSIAALAEGILSHFAI